MSNSINPVAIPLNMSLTAGPTPTPPADLLAALTAAVAAIAPDYTNNLPGSLIEDISSTDIGALVTIDQARVDAINSLSPYGANPYILANQGITYGIPQGQPTNTGVDVVFTGTVGYVIPAGFIVSDGTYQYITQEAGVIGSGGTSLAIYAVASQDGSWTPLADDVNQLVSVVPSGYTLTVNNPVAGTAGGASETVESYRSRIMQAGQACAQGITALIKSNLQKVPGVQANLVSVVQSGTVLKVICGGGDPYQIALAIFKSTINWPNLAISSTPARNISASIIEPPDTYTITFINPPAQAVALAVIWNTQLAYFTNGPQVNQLAQSALVAYLNAIPVGQPINLLQITSIFQHATASILSVDQIDTLGFTVTIDGSPATPEAGTSIIIGDPEGYFTCAASAVTVTQG